MVRRVEFSAIIRTIQGVPVLEASGEIDLASAGRFRTVLYEATSQNGGRLLVVDLTGVKFMGVEGTRELVESTRLFREGGGEVRIAAQSKEVDLVLRLTGMELYFSIYPDAFSAANGG